MAEPELPCDELDQTPFGRALVVTDDENCQRELIQESEDNYPALAIVHSDNRTSLADGSSEFPIPLPHLQTQVGGTFTKLMIQDASGVWYVFTPPETCITQRMLIVDGAFTFEDDVLPQLLNADFCEIDSCDQFDYLLGLKEITISCDGEDVTYLKPVKIPKNLCPTCAEEDTEESIELEHGGLLELEQGGNLTIE
jgi:hypothetical protein